MANRKRDAGREALEKESWWRSHRQLVLRRLCQSFVLGMFLSGLWFDVWILYDNYSGSLLFDIVLSIDPLMTLQSLISGHLPVTVVLTGTVIITVLYALVGERLFCSWVCSLNPITDLANWLRRCSDLNQSATVPCHTRYVLLVVILVGPALADTLIWEQINPVSLMRRSLAMGSGSSTLLILALFSLNLLIIGHSWCGHICPVGALYGVLGNRGVITVAATDRQRCNRCMDCFHVCPEPHVPRASVLDEQSPVQATGRDCMTCGYYVDVYSEDAFTVTTRWSLGTKS